MASIGFRCWADKFAFVVLSGTADTPEIIDSGICAVPAGMNRQECLVWLRKEITELLDKHNPGSGFFKCTEPNSQKKDMQRAEFEGVLQEAGLSHSSRLLIERRQKSQIKRDTRFSNPARYLHELLDSPCLCALNTKDFKEATLAALCGL